MLLGQKAKCVFPEKTLIRIINELWGGEWGVAEQTRILLVRNSAKHCQSALAIKSPNWSGSLMKTSILCNPQGGNDHRWEATRQGLSHFPEQGSVSGNPSKSSAPGNQEEVWPKGTFPAACYLGPGFAGHWSWQGRDVCCEMYRSSLSPPPSLADFFPPLNAIIQESALRKKNCSRFPIAHKKKY